MSRAHSTGLLAIACASGAAALIYETVWLRWFEQLFGSTAYAASATLCAFFTGLALGAAWGARLVGRSPRPLALYAWVELGAALAAPWVPVAVRLYEPIYAALYSSLADARAVFVLLKYVLAAAAMLPAATLLGATLPPLVAAFAHGAHELGRRGGALYAANTLGAAIGSALAAFWLIDRVGLRWAYALAVSLSLAAAVAALLLAKGLPARALVASAQTGRAAPSRVLAVAFASGFGTLALEVLLIRALAQVLDSSVYSFGAVMVVVLLCLAAGAALVSSSARFVAARSLLLGALVAEFLLLLALPGRLQPQLVSGLLVAGSAGNGLLLAALYGGPALLAGSLVLPLTFRMASESAGDPGRRVGGLLAANTVGGICGSLLASFALLDLLGLWASITALALGYGASVALVAARPVRAVAATAACGGAVLLAFGLPWSLPAVVAGPGERVLAVEEGAHGIVSVIEFEDGGRAIKVDNHYLLGGTRARVQQERTGHLPLLLHPAPRSVLFVGSATGGAAAAAVVHPVSRIELVELVPEVQRLAAAHFGAATRGVHADPRTRVVVEDGRNHLRGSPDRYDVIVGDLFVPWRPGVGNLYSREHFASVKRHLTPNGVFCQWLPIYQLSGDGFDMVVATFLDAFPDATLWRGDFLARRPVAALVGLADGARLEPAAVEDRVAELARAKLRDRWVTRPEGFWMLYVGPLAPLREELGHVPRQRDDHPRFEYVAGRSSQTKVDDFVERGWPAFVRRVLSAARTSDGPFTAPPPRRGELAARWAEAGRLAVGGREPAARKLLRALRAELPASLLAPRDATAADVWP